MAQEPTDRRRRPSAHMVKAERYFFSNWSLQRLLSRGEPRRTNRDRHAHSVCSCADPPAARVRAAPLDGRPCSVLANYARGRSPTKTRYRPATSEVNKQLTASKLCTQPARAAFNPAHTVNIDLTSALSFWPARRDCRRRQQDEPKLENRERLPVSVFRKDRSENRLPG